MSRPCLRARWHRYTTGALYLKHTPSHHNPHLLSRPFRRDKWHSYTPGAPSLEHTRSHQDHAERAKGSSEEAKVHDNGKGGMWFQGSLLPTLSVRLQPTM